MAVSRKIRHRPHPAARADVHHALLSPAGLMDRQNNPIDEWRLVETQPQKMPLGLSETLFALSNGYIGVRANPVEGRDSFEHGTYINGFHESWPIRHAEDAFGLARWGQTIVNAPDAKTVRLYIDDEPLRLGSAEIEDYERSLDFREGVLRRRMHWITAGGKNIRLTTERMVSFEQKHLMLVSMEVELLDADAGVILTSEILNRQDGEDEFHDPGVMAAAAAEMDPRRAEKIEERVLIPRLQENAEPGRATLGYQTAHSGMTLACAMSNELTVTTAAGAEEPEIHVRESLDGDKASVMYRMQAQKGTKIRLEKYVSYHSSRDVKPEELMFRCDQTIERAEDRGFAELIEEQGAFLDRFWARSDVEIVNQPDLQQAVRWNLWQLLQASARAEKNGIPAKGMTGSGYSGHYFWDTEIYVMPFLCYTNPHYARNALRFRYDMLPAARERAEELSHNGALFPWRTISGWESSAYYAAGTAQYHIDAAVVYALMKYVYATGDIDFLLDEGADILVDTARFWMSLGFFNSDRTKFSIHSVTGPDEYTTVVNNNLYTNLMAQYNLFIAAEMIRQMSQDRPADLKALVDKYGIEDGEVAGWREAAEKMNIPFSEKYGIHPQDDEFLDREHWKYDDPVTGPKRPLLLYYHPLTIYRHQVLKQADVVLALFLRGDQFSIEEKRADYDYYDPLTTGDSSLSAVVQSIVAAELGYEQKAMDFFLRGLFVDLGNLHKNAADGVHVASAGGVWQSLVYGFGGFRDYNGNFSINPCLPDDWDSLTYRVTIHGNRIKVTVRRTAVELVVEDGEHRVGPIMVGDREVIVDKDPITIVLK